MTGSQPHPSKEITGSHGSELAGKKIVLCVTGSVAAYRAVDMARLLMRHGADVYTVMSDPTSQLLPSEMMKWATGNDVVTSLTGDLEHIRLADYDMSDLVLVYPCTANTIGKAAAGIDDTPVTSVLSVALGSKIPVVIAPAMHQAMYENPFILQNVEKLKKRAIFVEPTMAEGKAKVAEPSQVLAAAIEALSSGPLSGRNVLVTAGSTVEFIDPIRVLTNLSTGRMGVAIAKEARKLGASVTLVFAHGSVEPDAAAGKVIRVGTSNEMLAAVTSELSSKKYDIAIMAAAVADFAPSKRSRKKIDSREGSLKVELVKTVKIVDRVKQISKRTFLVAFKADHDVDRDILVDKAYKKLKESGADLVIANDVGKVSKAGGSEMNEVFVVDAAKKVTHLPIEEKSRIARKLLELVASMQRSKGA